jgi:hypothetical protein
MRYKNKDCTSRRTRPNVWLVGAYVAIRAVDSLLRTWDEDSGKPPP